MRILAIETSCDETGAAVIQDGRKVLSNVVASSQETHVKSGGIIPENAAREQVKSIMQVIDNAVCDAFSVSVPDQARNDIRAIAVTVGPGLIGSLLVGVETAKTLSYLWDKPLIPVNHLHGHIYSAWLSPGRNPKSQILNTKQSAKPEFPIVALVVSGGHTDLVLMKDHDEIELLGSTRDDAAGEAFDKTARILGLPYPGGPSIAASAAEYATNNKTHRKLDLFPRPMIDSDNYDFSFSGLKTAVHNYVISDKRKEISKDSTERMSAEIQAAITDVLITKTMNAVNQYKPKSLIISGGVAANRNLRETFAKEISRQGCEVSLHVPVSAFCTDNAAMIGAAAFYINNTKNWREVEANPELRIID